MNLFLAAKCSTINHLRSNRLSNRVSLKPFAFLPFTQKIFIFPQKLQFATYGQFVLVLKKITYICDVMPWMLGFL